jgi:hypothetical protein
LRTIWFIMYKSRPIYTVKQRFTSFPSPAGMSVTKLPLGRNNSARTSLFPPRESLVVTSRLGTGNSRTFFLRCNDITYTVFIRPTAPFKISTLILAIIISCLFLKGPYIQHYFGLQESNKHCFLHHYKR